MAKQEKYQDFDELDQLISRALQNEKTPDLPADFSYQVIQKIAEVEKSQWQYKPLIGKKTWGLIAFVLVSSSALTYFSDSSEESSTLLNGLSKLLMPFEALNFSWFSMLNQPTLAFSVLSVCSITLIYFYILTRKTSFKLEL